MCTGTAVHDEQTVGERVGTLPSMTVAGTMRNRFCLRNFIIVLGFCSRPRMTANEANVMSTLWLYSRRAGPGIQHSPHQGVSLAATNARHITHDVTSHGVTRRNTRRGDHYDVVSMTSKHYDVASDTDVASIDDTASIVLRVPAGGSRWTRGARRGSAPDRNCRPGTAWPMPPGSGRRSPRSPRA